MLDIKKIRADTPACEHVIHFNNAGASLMPTPVYDAVTQHLESERKYGGYEAADRASEALASFYYDFSALLNCEPEEIAYVENATRAWDMAFYGLRLEPGDHVLTHSSEYSSNFMALLQRAQRRGFAIDIAPSDSSGQIDVDAMEKMIGPKTRLIALTHVPTQGGLVNPAEAVGKVAHKHGVTYLLDACQSVGQINLDVEKIGCDVLSGTGRKFLRGPRGTGFLYVAKDMIDNIDPPFIDMHSAEWTGPTSYDWADGAKRFENWESYVAGRIGLSRAVRYAYEIGLETIEARVTYLGQMFRDALASTPGISVHDLGERKCGIVTLRKEGEEPADTKSRLAEQRINVSITERPSAQLDFGERNLDAIVRASVHYYNTENEIDRFIDVLKG